MGTKFNQGRRRFLRNLALAAGGSSLLSYQGKLQLIQSALASSNAATAAGDEKSLVCVFLFGGNDSFNMFVPYEQTAYDNYASIRQNLAIPRAELLPVTGNQQAFHPGMSNMRDLYDQGKLAVVSNLGTLFEPTTRADYQNGLVQVPPDLFSHSHQQSVRKKL